MSLRDLTNIRAGDAPYSTDISLPPPQQDPYAGMMAPQYNPFAQGVGKSWDAQCMDRMITIHRPSNVKKGMIWLTEASFAETLSLLPLNKNEQQHYIRKFRKAMMAASGELSQEEVYQRQELIFVELISQKSRLDVMPGGNLNERESWITSTQRIESVLKTPPPAQSRGFFGSLLGGGR